MDIKKYYKKKTQNYLFTLTIKALFDITNCNYKANEFKK